MNYGKKENHFKEGLELKGEDFLEGLAVVQFVRRILPGPGR